MMESALAGAYVNKSQRTSQDIFAQIQFYSPFTGPVGYIPIGQDTLDYRVQSTGSIVLEKVSVAPPPTPTPAPINSLYNYTENGYGRTVEITNIPFNQFPSVPFTVQIYTTPSIAYYNEVPNGSVAPSWISTNAFLYKAGDRYYINFNAKYNYPELVSQYFFPYIPSTVVVRYKIVRQAIFNNFNQ